MAVLCAVLGGVVACAGTRLPGRAALTLGESVADDEAIRGAERTLAEGDLPRARELWAALEGQHRTAPTGRFATLRLARIDLAFPGDAAVVRGGHLGRYLAHGYARMLAIYGPNPSGMPSSRFRSFRLDGTAGA